MNNEYRQQHIVATDLADRLLPGLNPNEFLLWPPNLFAYTSYILSMTGGYQLVISPPTGRKWFPELEFIDKWLSTENASANLQHWMKSITEGWGLNEFYEDSKIQRTVLKLLGNRLSSPGDRSVEIRGVRKWLEKQDRSSPLEPKGKHNWKSLVKKLGYDWKERIGDISREEFDRVDLAEPETEELRHYEMFKSILARTPPAVLACWAYVHQMAIKNVYEWPESGHSSLRIASLLCNRDFPDNHPLNRDELWGISQAIITLHAIADEACVGWGIVRVATQGEGSEKRAEFDADNARYFSEKLLFGRGTLSTFNPERCRVLPKRHNPSLGITLRSLSSNLAFHRSSVEVVWRRTDNNQLAKKLRNSETELANVDEPKTHVSILLLPMPRHVKTKDFQVVEAYKNRVEMGPDYQFFEYKPQNIPIHTITDLIARATDELPEGEAVDIVVLPESALTEDDMYSLEIELAGRDVDSPSILVAGIREDPEFDENPDLSEDDTRVEDAKIRFQRNAVYCKYLEQAGRRKNYGEKTDFAATLSKRETPKYKQYKHHRWRLDDSQIKQYGLSQIFGIGRRFWEATKIPRRRVSFLNVGDRMTLCHLICEDLARQDPIADLIRHIGPSLVVTILLDGPQKADRWSSRYASVLSEDPGCSVITLTAFGMVRRWNSPHRGMSRVVALWSEKNLICREIELAQGAEAILLNLEVDKTSEVTADGREESDEHKTSLFKLVDVIQIYPDWPATHQSVE